MIHFLLEAGIPPEQLVLVAEERKYAPASGVPFGLMHPCPGRSLKPKPGVLDAYAFSSSWLRKMQGASSDALLLELPMVRPFIKAHPSGARLQKSFVSLPAPFWAEKLHPSEVATRWPCFAPSDGAAMMGPAFCVSLPMLLEYLASQAYQKGVSHYSDDVHVLKQQQETWEVVTGRGTLSTRHVVLAVGAGLGDWFPALPLQQSEGELLVGEADILPALQEMVSFSGHISPTPDGRYCIGSTYIQPPETSTGSVLAVWEQLRSKLSSFWPHFPELTNPVVWGGTRCLVRHQFMPIAGPHPELSGLYVLGALASKGLLWTPSLASQLTATICQQEETLPSSVLLSRFSHDACIFRSNRNK